MEFGIEKYAMLVMKSGKRDMIEGIELPNQENMKTLREKEMYKYWKLAPSNKWKWKKKKTELSQENQKAIWDKTLSQEPYKRDRYLGYRPRKILVTILEVDQRNLQTNGPKNKKTNAHA